jgi:Flp pilus assembly protein TadD
MFARLLLFAAMVAPVFSQDTDDVTKYLTELRAKTPVRDEKAAARRELTELTKHLEAATDPKQKAELYTQMALQEQSLDDLGAAIAAIRNASELAPDDRRITAELAYLLVQDGQKDEASAILGVDVTDGEALTRRADRLIDDGEKDLAVMCLKLAQKALPDDPGVDDRFAIIYLRAEKVDEAIRMLNLAASKAPDSAPIHLHLAFAFAQKDYREYARSELNTALECHPSDEIREGIRQLRALLDTPK